MMNNNYEAEMRENESGKKFDREEWIRQKQAEREKAFALIDQITEKTGKDGASFKACLDLVSRFERLSVSNILLLAAQKPDAKKLADFKTWQESKVSVKKGEVGILLLEPGKDYTRRDGTVAKSFNTKKVFDVSQTDQPFAVDPVVRKDDKLLLKELIRHAPCQFQHIDPWRMPDGKIARYDAGKNTIFVVNGENVDRTFSAMSVELAKAHLAKEGYDAAMTPFVAMAASYILCRRNGIDLSVYSFDHLPEEYSLQDRRQIKETIGKIRSLANEITADMNRTPEKDGQSRDEAR